MEELALWISVLSWLAGMKAIPHLWFRLLTCIFIVEFPQIYVCDCALKMLSTFSHVIFSHVIDVLIALYLCRCPSSTSGPECQFLDNIFNPLGGGEISKWLRLEKSLYNYSFAYTALYNRQACLNYFMQAGETGIWNQTKHLLCYLT